MTIPDASVAASAEIPLAQLLEVPPSAPEVVEPVAEVVDAPRPRRKRVGAKPTPTLDLTAPPEFDAFSFLVPPEPVQPTFVPEPEPFPFVPEPEPLRGSKVESPALETYIEPPASSAVDPTPKEASGKQWRRPRGRFAVLALASVLSVALIVLGSHAISDTGSVATTPRVETPAPVAIADAARVPEPAKVDPPAAPATAPGAVAPATPIASAPNPTPNPPPIDPTVAPATTVPPAADIAAPAPTVTPARPLVIRRRQLLGQEALRVQLAHVPELSISHETENLMLFYHGLPLIQHQAHHGHSQAELAGPAGFLGPAVTHHASRPAANLGGGMHVANPEDKITNSITLIKRRQPELSHLPWQMGDDCHLSREPAEELEIRSKGIRTLLQQSIPSGDIRPNAEMLRASLLGEVNVPEGAVVVRSTPGALFLTTSGPRVRSDTPTAIPALMQLLMAERTPAREVLVEVLARIKGSAASKALARLAIFDVAPEVRERALVALRERPADEYRTSLLDGFRYPWAPVADHSAEALVALEDRESVPELIKLLDQPDPIHPRTEIRNGQTITYSRSLVQVNHLRNCLLCHAPSANPTTDLVRARIPTEGKPLPPPVQYYGDNSRGDFVRAEVTYLRQDFSLVQPVEDHGPWPGYQRYDYLVLEKPVPTSHAAHPAAKAKEEDRRHSYPQRESVLFALRNLTGEDHGEDSAAWKAANAPK